MVKIARKMAGEERQERHMSGSGEGTLLSLCAAPGGLALVFVLTLRVCVWRAICVCVCMCAYYMHMMMGIYSSLARRDDSSLRNGARV